MQSGFRMFLPVKKKLAEGADSVDSDNKKATS
jgi:hypothetical protein